MERSTQDLFEDFAVVIEEAARLAGDIARTEADKAQAASSRQHHLLDGYVQEEQAQILKLRGLEQRRQRLARGLGWDSLTFRQILDRASEPQERRLAPLFEELERQLGRLKDSKGAAEQMINVRLHELNLLIARQTGASYGQDGSVNAAPPLHSAMKDTYG